MKFLFYLKKISSNSDDRKKFIPFKKDEILFGRSKTCNHVILDPSISRTHALFKKCGDGWIVKNLSTNGLFLDKDELYTEEERYIKNGSIISIGHSGNFQFRFGVKTLNSDKCEESLMSESSLDSQNRDLEEKLRKAENSHGVLLKEREDLIDILNREKEMLHNDFLAKEEALEKKLNDGILVEKTLVEEKEKLAENLKSQVIEMKTKHENTIKTLENKLKMEEDIKILILKEKEDLTAKFHVEKEALEKRLVEEKKEVENTLITERLELQNKLASLEEQRINLEKKVEDNEQFLKLKEEEQVSQQNILLKAFESLKAEKERLNNQLNAVESNLEEKLLLTSTLEGELKEKEKMDKELETLIEEKKNLEKKLSKAFENKTQVSELEESLQLVQAQKLSLEQEIASVAIVSKSAREEVVESVSNVLENEFQCSICSELFVTAITLNCSHTFCQYCIDSWKKNKKECPNCRQRITSETRSIVLDNFIEKIVSTLSETMKEQRNQVIAERNMEVEAAKAREAPVVIEVATTTRGRGRGRNTRQNARQNNRGGRGRGRGSNSATTHHAQSTSSAPAPSTIRTLSEIRAATFMAARSAVLASSTVPTPSTVPTLSTVSTPSTAPAPSASHPVRQPSPITIDSDSDSSHDDSDNSASSYESGVSGVYFGGYGRCYNCGRRGHWANGCPDYY